MIRAVFDTTTETLWVGDYSLGVRVLQEDLRMLRAELRACAEALQQAELFTHTCPDTRAVVQSALFQPLTAKVLEQS